MAESTEDLRRQMLARILTERAATELDPTAQWHPQIDLAAIAAFNALGDAAHEQGGLLFQNNDGLYGYSLPVPGGHSSFSLRARFDPTEMKPAGIYHTHPGGGDAHLFSASDIDTAMKLKLLSFIKAIESGEIRRFDPVKSSTRNTGERGLWNQRRRVSPGELVQQGKK